MSLAITPTAGVVYQLLFRSGYEAFDGIYRVVKLMTYEEYLGESRDAYDDFFSVTGKTMEEMAPELLQVQESKMLKLIKPNVFDEEDNLVYVPMDYVLEVPDYNVKKYYQMGLIVTLGITAEEDELEYAAEAMIDHFESALGVTPDPKFITTREVWLTEQQYKEVLAERDETKKKIINYYSECVRLRDQLSRFQTQIASYEEIIKDQNQQIQTLLSQV